MEDSLDQRHAIKFCVKLGKNAEETFLDDPRGRQAQFCVKSAGREVVQGSWPSL